MLNTRFLGNMNWMLRLPTVDECRYLCLRYKDRGVRNAKIPGLFCISTEDEKFDISNFWEILMPDENPVVRIRAFLPHQETQRGRNWVWAPVFVPLTEDGETPNKEYLADIPDGYESRLGALLINDKVRDPTTGHTARYTQNRGHIDIRDSDDYNYKYHIPVVKYGNVFLTDVPLLSSVSIADLEKYALIPENMY